MKSWERGGGKGGGEEGAGNEAATTVIERWMVCGNQGMAWDGMRLCCHGYRRCNVKLVNWLGLTQCTEVASGQNKIRDQQNVCSNKQTLAVTQCYHGNTICRMDNMQVYIQKKGQIWAWVYA